MTQGPLRAVKSLIPDLLAAIGLAAIVLIVLITSGLFPTPTPGGPIDHGGSIETHADYSACGPGEYALIGGDAFLCRAMEPSNVSAAELENRSRQRTRAAIGNRTWRLEVDVASWNDTATLVGNGTAYANDWGRLSGHYQIRSSRNGSVYNETSGAVWGPVSDAEDDLNTTGDAHNVVTYYTEAGPMALVDYGAWRRVESAQAGEAYRVYHSRNNSSSTFYVLVDRDTGLPTQSVWIDDGWRHNMTVEWGTRVRSGGATR